MTNKKEDIQEDINQETDVNSESKIDYTPLNAASLKSIGAFTPSVARRLFFTWKHPETQESHHASFYYKELTFGSIERMMLAKKTGDEKRASEVLAECLFEDEKARKRLFTAKQLQEELHPSLVAAIFMTVDQAQKKTS